LFFKVIHISLIHIANMLWIFRSSPQSVDKSWITMYISIFFLKKPFFYTQIFSLIKLLNFVMIENIEFLSVKL